MNDHVGREMHRYPPNLEPRDLAAWLIATVDSEPDLTAGIVVNTTGSEFVVQTLEDEFRIAFDLARRLSGRDLRVKLHHSKFVGGGPYDGESRILAVVTDATVDSRRDVA